MPQPIPEYDPGHVPVLLRETLEALSPQPGETYLDATAGLGGHASAIAVRLGATGRVMLVDMDGENLKRAEAHVRSSCDLAGRGVPEIVTLRDNYAEAPRALSKIGWRADLALADLGFASPQVDDPARGLSFRREGPLDMRLDPSQPVTAAEIVGTWSEGDLARILREYGEEPAAGRIARKIVETRSQRPIHTTIELAAVVREAVGPPRGPSRKGARRLDPATRTFQAVRMAVNDELGNLRSLLGAVERGAAQANGAGWLAPGARVAIISFHSLEDRPVKQTWRGLVERAMATDPGRQPVRPTEAEQISNPRSRSAKLRWLQLTAAESAGAMAT